MLRNVLFCASLALALTLTAGCKKEEKAGKVDLNAVEGTYKGTLTWTYEKSGDTKTEETSVKVSKLDGLTKSLGDYMVDGLTAKIKSNENGKLILAIEGLGIAKGEAELTGSELSFKIAHNSIVTYTKEFKGKKQ